MNNNDARDTIIQQLVAGVFCLLIGGGIFTLLIIWAESWGVRFSDNSEYSFTMYGLFGYPAIIALTALVAVEQFMKALSPKKTLVKSIKSALFGGAFLLVAIGIFTGLVGGIEILFFHSAFVLLASISIGTIIGLVQALSLYKNHFDLDKHKNRISHTADLEACKLNILPYRQKVAGFWRVFGFGFFTLCLGTVIILPFISKKPVSGEAFVAVLGLIFVFGLVAYNTYVEINFLKTKQLQIIVGKVTNKTRRFRSPFLIECDGKEFMTDGETWDRLEHIGFDYKLWFSPNSHRAGRVIAFESQDFEFDFQSNSSFEIEDNNGYFRIKNDKLEKEPFFQSGDKVVWCRQRFADGSFWGTKVIVFGATPKRIVVEMVQRNQTELKYIKPTNLVSEDAVVWEDGI